MVCCRRRFRRRRSPRPGGIPPSSVSSWIRLFSRSATYRLPVESVLGDGGRFVELTAAGSRRAEGVARRSLRPRRPRRMRIPQAPRQALRGTTTSRRPLVFAISFHHPWLSPLSSHSHRLPHRPCAGHSPSVVSRMPFFLALRPAGQLATGLGRCAATRSGHSGPSGPPSSTCRRVRGCSEEALSCLPAGHHEFFDRDIGKPAERRAQPAALDAVDPGRKLDVDLPLEVGHHVGQAVTRGAEVDPAADGASSSCDQPVAVPTRGGRALVGGELDARADRPDMSVVEDLARRQGDRARREFASPGPRLDDRGDGRVARPFTPPFSLSREAWAHS